ncbi:sensor domain-containing diguanylate cyclase [Solimonas terrae]|uniref:GGDEF domain-containing protein n=1 Tax=Solimonas terrae TaxID=1396819 RepID=A0A6M2BR31_9GAMM|nr:sensor domain-containing diguanylate cyclase [Solimonas terrae]NGY04804.1 GGDEF domain-containing protein [Solimonas terrae]
MHSFESSPPSTERLLAVIKVQAEIARQGPDLAAVMALATDRALDLTAATGAVIELAEMGDMVYRATAGVILPFIGLRLSLRGSLSGLCVSSGAVLRCDDSETDERVDREACRRIGVRSMVVVPLRHQDAVIGVLKVTSERSRAFGPGETQILELLSEMIGASMYHATRFEADELFHRATHDAMTGLANRALFFDRLRHCLARAARHREQVAVIQLDMDGLKPINDRWGHRAGDQAIVEFARRLRQSARGTDTVARLGGDEFAILMPQVSNRDEPESLALRVHNECRAPFDFDGQSLPLRASTGVALYPADGEDPIQLVERADHAMYAQKRRQQQAQRAPAR